MKPGHMLRSVTICTLLRIQHASTKAIIVVCLSAFRVSGHKLTAVEFSLTGTTRNFSPKSFSEILDMTLNDIDGNHENPLPKQRLES
ncbi:hypothetical protein SESBI_50671, partial [Sesbania bispinosa]